MRRNQSALCIATLLYSYTEDTDISLHALNTFPLQAWNSALQAMQLQQNNTLWGGNSDTCQCRPVSCQSAVFPYALFRVDVIAEMKCNL